MRTFKGISLLTLLLAACTGCIVVRDDPPPRRRVVVVQETPAATIEVSNDTAEVHDVVYREYYGCTDAEIVLLPHYRRYYGLTDDDFYFLFFVCRRSSITFDACFHSYYYDCGRSYDRLVVSYNVPREHFFVSVGVGVTTYPPIYARTYACYRSGSYAGVTFTNTEYVGLVHMRVACDYQGHAPNAYFARVQATGSTSRVIIESKERCGQGGHTVVGAQVTVRATRAWTLPPQQRQDWHQQRQANVVKVEATFKEHHAEQVQKVQAREKAAPAKSPNGQGASTAAHAKTTPEHGPDGHPVEKHPTEAHPQPEKKRPAEEHEKKGEKEK